MRALSRVPDDRAAMVSLSARSRPWPAPRRASSVAPGISSASAWPCSSGNIGSAVPWMTSVGAVIEDSGLLEDSPSGSAMVLRRSEVPCALDIATDRSRIAGSSNRRRLPRALASRQPDTRRPMPCRTSPPPRSRRTQVRVCRGRELAVAGHRGRSADQYEREDTLGEVERQQLRERPARRDPDDVRSRNAVGVEHADGVGDQVRARVVRDARARR